MQKAGIAAIILMFSLIATNVLASEDFLHGEVLNIDREAMRITVRTNWDETREGIRTVAMTESLLVVTKAGDKRFPGCVRLGSRVRIWGTVIGTGQEAIFLAEQIRGCGMKSCNDPTGVRERLNRSRKPGMAGACCR